MDQQTPQEVQSPTEKQEKELGNLQPLASLADALPGDAVYREGVPFGCIMGMTDHGWSVALHKEVEQRTYFPQLSLKVTSVEITQDQVDRGLFEVFARDPVVEFPQDREWDEMKEIPF